MATKASAAQRESEMFDAGSQAILTPEMDRRNGSIFLLSWLLIYLAAPVMYIDVVQAALCNKLGAGVTVANLPASAYFFGSFSPFFFSWLVPHRMVRTVAVVAYAVTASLLAL